MANSAVEKQFPRNLKKNCDVLHSSDFRQHLGTLPTQQVPEFLSIVVGILKAKRESSPLRLSLRAREEGLLSVQ